MHDEDDDDMTFDDWPNCAVKGCPNKCCLRLQSRYCWPHTPGTPQQAIDNLRETEPQLFPQTETV